MRAKHKRNTQFLWNGAKQFGLDTSVKVQFSSAVHNTTMAFNLARALAKH